MPNRKNSRANLLGRCVSFIMPFVLAMVYWLASEAPGLAQSMGGDPSQFLQQLNRNGGIGGLFGGMGNGVVDTTSQLPQSQTLQPQNSTAMVRLPQSRLEQIMSARANIKLTQFGYDQFGVGRTVMVPETGAVADDYILGPGDDIAVSLRGQENNDFRVTVGRDGNVVLPRLKPIAASGRTFGSFRQDVEAAVQRAYVASTATTSIGRVRQINVMVGGEVNAAGPRLVTGLSSALDALLLAGGVKKTGSLRNIRLQRAGRVYNIDLYGALTGTGGGAMRLADGDRLIVPPLGAIVAMAGLVRRPGIYELAAHASSIPARNLLALAGGQEVRGRYRMSVLRIEADGRSNLAALPGDNGLIRDSEILRVELGADLSTSQATLSGGLGLAGQYAVTTGTRLSDVVRAPGALGTSPYTLFGIIVRKDPRTLMRSLLAFTPAAVLGGAEDMPLQTDDVIRPITVNEADLLTFVVRIYLEKLGLDQSRIRNPLETVRAEAAAAAAAVTPGANQGNNGNNGNNGNGNNYSPVLSAAAATAAATAALQRPVSPDNPYGVTPGTLEAFAGQESVVGVPAELLRSNIIALLDTAAPGTLMAQQRQAAYERAQTQTSNFGPAQNGASPFQTQQNGPPSQAAAVPAYGDGYNSGLQPPGMLDQNGQQVGGMQSQPTPLNYQEQPITAGGYASNQEVHTFGELSRQLGVDPLVLVNFLIDHRANLDGAVRGPGSYFVGPNASLNDLVQAAGGTVSWADESGVELLTTVVDSRSGSAASQRQTLPLRQGTLASYVVRPRDQLHFNQVYTDSGIGSVTIQGEVRFGGNYPITRGEHLSNLLMRVGGITSTGYPAGTVFLRKSAAQIEQEGYNRAANEIQSQLLAGMAGSSGQIPVNAVQSFISQLRNQRALGRIAIAADPSVLAANPQLDPLLEAGDVIFIPQRPSTVAVLGEVMQPGSYSYQPGFTLADYIKKAGGTTRFSEDDLTFVVQPDGSARRMETSWLGYDAARLPPGSAIVVPRELVPFTFRQFVQDASAILSSIGSLAVTAATLAVLAKQ